MRLFKISSDTIRGRARVCLFAGLALAFSSTLHASAPRESAAEDAGRAPRESAAENDGAVSDTLYTAPAIIVEAPRITRGASDVFRQSGFIAVIDLGDRKDRVESLASVLSRAVGLQVREYGGLGGFATVSIRGSSSSQVDLFLDGIPLGDAYTGTANLGDLPLGGFEAIEIYRGSSPARLGSSAIGGVVNLRTEMPGAKTPRHASGLAFASDAEGRVSYGSFGTSRVTAAAWPSIGPVRAFLHGSLFETEGDFVFANDNGTPENSGDDRETVRINNDAETLNLLGRVETRAGDAGRVSLAHNTVLRENGVPGIGTDQSATARSERSAHRTSLEIDPEAWFNARLDFLADAYYSASNERFTDLNADIGLTKQDTDNDFRTAGTRVRSALDLHPVTLELLWDGKDERFLPRSNVPAPSEGPERARESSMTALSADLRVERLSAVLSFTGRLHSYTSEFYDPPRFPWLPPQPEGRVSGDRRTAQYGFRWLPASFLTVKGNWGEYYRLPTFLELFGNTGSVTGSFDLEPETGLNRDIGVVFAFDRALFARSVFFEAVYLDNEVENLILYFPNSQFTSRPQNIGKARIRGVELSFSSLVSGRLRLSGNYTYLDGEDTGPIPYYNGNDLPGRPKHDLAAQVDFSRRSVTLSYEYHRISANYLDPANQSMVPARNIHNAAVRWTGLGRGLAMTIEGRNLADDRVSDVSGFPLPGRSYFVTMSYQYQGG